MKINKKVLDFFEETWEYKYDETNEVLYDEQTGEHEIISEEEFNKKIKSYLQQIVDDPNTAESFKASCKESLDILEG